jgi:DNA-binding NtrC family response regulator
MYGTQVLTGIKKINSSLPVIILTGHGSKEDEKKCMALGAYEFVNKPMHIDDIIERLNQFKKEA